MHITHFSNKKQDFFSNPNTTFKSKKTYEVLFYLFIKSLDDAAGDGSLPLISPVSGGTIAAAQTDANILLHGIHDNDMLCIPFMKNVC